MRYALIVFLFACGSKSKPSEPPANTTPNANDCLKSGCSGTVCVEPGKEVVTTCEYKPEYGCYKEGVCERQGDGRCAWTESPALTACLANPPAMEAGPAPQ
jgi:eight-cysteine-cluster-containing protein